MPILYTAIGYASSNLNRIVISFVYTALGYTNNDINLGCTTIGEKVLSALIGCRIVVYAGSVCAQPLGTQAVQ